MQVLTNHSFAKFQAHLKKHIKKSFLVHAGRSGHSLSFTWEISSLYIQTQVSQAKELTFTRSGRLHQIISSPACILRVSGKNRADCAVSCFYSLPCPR